MLKSRCYRQDGAISRHSLIMRLPMRDCKKQSAGRRDLLSNIKGNRAVTSRRNFLTKLGAGLLFPSQLFAQDNRRKNSIWDALFSNQVTLPPPMRPDPSTWRDSTITAS